MNILHEYSEYSSALTYSVFLMFKQNYCVYQLTSPYSRALKLLKLMSYKSFLRGEL